jgi:hypothetical protein
VGFASDEQEAHGCGVFFERGEAGAAGWSFAGLHFNFAQR